LPKVKKGAFRIPTSTVAAEQDFTFDNITIALNSDVQVLGNWLFSRDTKILGNGFTLDISNGGALQVRTGSSLEIEDVKIVGLKNNNLECVSHDASINIKNTILQLERNFTFSLGSILFQNEVVISGTHHFIYTSVATSSIDKQSSLLVSKNTTLKFAPNGTASRLLNFSDATSRLYFDGATLHTTSTALKLLRGTIIIDNHVTFSSEGTNSGEATEFKSDTSLNLLGGAVLDIYGYFNFE